MDAGIDPGGELGGYRYGGEMDVFEAMGAPVYEPYDPFSGMTPSMIAGGYAQNFPIEAFEPDPYYQSPIQGPLDYIWEEFAVPIGSKMINEALFGKELEERAVQEGAGVTVLYTQPQQAGGAPAQPYQQIIPGAAAPPQAVKLSATILIGAGLVVLYFLFR